MTVSPASVTAIIPAYNAAALLPRTLESVLAQTVPLQDVIVIDDGSTDATEAVVAKYPVRYIRQKNRGPAAARNTGIRAAATEWVAFLDADDCWVPEKIERQLALARSHPEASIFYSDALVVQPDGRALGRFLHGKSPANGWIFDPLLKSMFVLPSTVLMRREVFFSAGLFAEDLLRVDDYDMWLRLAPKHQFYFVPEPLTLYERQEGSLSRNSAAMARAEISVLEPYLKQRLTVEQSRRIRRRLANRLFDLAYDARGKNYREAIQLAWSCVCMEPRRLQNWPVLITNLLWPFLPSKSG